MHTTVGGRCVITIATKGLQVDSSMYTYSIKNNKEQAQYLKSCPFNVVDVMSTNDNDYIGTLFLTHHKSGRRNHSGYNSWDLYTFFPARKQGVKMVDGKSIHLGKVNGEECKVDFVQTLTMPNGVQYEKIIQVVLKPCTNLTYMEEAVLLSQIKWDGEIAFEVSNITEFLRKEHETMKYLGLISEESEFMLTWEPEWEPLTIKGWYANMHGKTEEEILQSI